MSEKQNNKKEYHLVILAALLHDIGKISQRTGGKYYLKHLEFSGNFISSLKEFFGEELCKTLAELIGRYHLAPTSRNEMILHLADLAAAGRETERGKGLKSDEAALVTITSRIKLQREPDQEKYHQLGSLNVESRNMFFPVNESKVKKNAYEIIWNSFVDKIKLLRKYQPTDFSTLYFLVREFGTFVPSATPWEKDERNRTIPDISLFDHSKITCAISACLYKLSKKELTNDELQDLVVILRQYQKPNFDEVLENSEITKKSLFLLLRGDVAGIQKFIYRIVKPKAETKGTGKRLRGRSFYLTLLTEVVTDWIIRSLNLPITNILFCGGGRFDILVPSNKLENIERLEMELNQWLFKEFEGELSIQIAKIKVAPKDFYQFNEVYRKAEEELLRTKQHKFRDLMKDVNFFKSSEHVEDICSGCQISPVKKKWDLCNQCKKQKNIGENLPSPRTNFMIFIYNGTARSIAKERVIPFEKFGVNICLVEKKQDVSEILENQTSQEEIAVYRLNPKLKENEGLDFLLKRKGGKVASFGFKFLGNAAPVALKECHILSLPKESIKKGEILDFEEIAELSQGAKYLGVLKMDVDRLGLIFALGISSPSVSRIATLSSNLDLFFSAWLNQICEEVTQEWEKNLPQKDKGRGLLQKSLFYIVYSGGDDLLIIGPWDQTIELAGKIYKDFRRYTSLNPNITLSGGILFVKPHFPIQRFAQLVGEELEKSKQGRDRITLFDETTEWKEETQSFNELLNFAKWLYCRVEKGKLPTGFVYYLRRLKESHFSEKGKNQMWVPKFFYSLGRRVKDKEVRVELQSKIPGMMNKIKIPVSYVSLMVRKR